MKKTLCPFSKPIIGGWCKCQYANMDDRCAGKMTCLKSDVYLTKCYILVDTLKENALFILGISHSNTQLTHMQLMKIRCGGLIGMQKLLSPNLNGSPDVLDTMQQINKQYGDVLNFPFDKIVQDIKLFSHRKKRT